MEEFKDFLEEVLDKSKNSQKDITIFLDFIENEKQKIIDEEKKAKTKEVQQVIEIKLLQRCN